MDQDGRAGRRDLLFRQVVDACQAVLAADGYVLAERGTNEEVTWVRFLRVTDVVCARPMPVLQLTHDRAGRWLQADTQPAGDPGPRQVQYYPAYAEPETAEQAVALAAALCAWLRGLGPPVSPGEP